MGVDDAEEINKSVERIILDIPTSNVKAHPHSDKAYRWYM